VDHPTRESQDDVRELERRIEQLTNEIGELKERHLHEVEVLKEQMQREREERADIEK
jgi:hypothetical protein